MNRLILFLPLFVFFISPIKTIASDLRASRLIDKQQEQNRGYKDEITEGTMFLYNASGKKTSTRKFELKQLESNNQQGVKTLITLLKPVDLMGVRLLSHQNPQDKEDQWLYLPAFKKTKRISGSGKKGAFLGSEFTYEDLQPKNAKNYEYEFLKRELCNNKTCSVVLAKPTFSSSYSQSKIWIGEDNYQTVKIELFDKKGELFKELILSDYRKINRFWRPFNLVMKNLQNGRETQLVIQDIHLKTGLKDEDFSKRVLER